MTPNQRDYVEFREVAKAGRLQWIERRFPGGAPVNWWLFVLDRVEADLSESRSLDSLARYESAAFGVGAIEVAVSSGSISEFQGISLLARLSLRARRVLPEDQLAVSLGADYLVRRALSLMPLSLAEAALAAARRRSEVSNGATYSGSTNALPQDDGIDKLYIIEDVLSALEPLLPLVHDTTARDLLATWLDFQRSSGL